MYQIRGIEIGNPPPLGQPSTKHQTLLFRKRLNAKGKMQHVAKVLTVQYRKI